MRVSEIFLSIQGESSYAGLPCAFVRLVGCNLRCGYCDTTYAYEGGTEMPLDNIVAELTAISSGLVEITGGEPLLDKDTPELARRLLDKGNKVLVETNGSQDISVLPSGTVVIMDIKTPSSGEQDSFLDSNLDAIKQTDEVKFVLSDREDYIWAMDYINDKSLADKCNVILSPVFGVLSPAELSEWMLMDRVRARLGLQLHKYIHGPDKRGV